MVLLAVFMSIGALVLGNLFSLELRHVKTILIIYIHMFYIDNIYVYYVFY